MENYGGSEMTGRELITTILTQHADLDESIKVLNEDENLYVELRRVIVHQNKIEIIIGETE